MKNLLFIFGQLTDEDVDWLTKQGKRRDVSGDTRVIREGEPVDDIYILLEGACTVSRDAGGEIARIGAGEMIGEMSFIDASPPSASVIAATDSVMLQIPRAALAHRLESDGGFAARFYRAVAMMLSDRLRDAVHAGVGSQSKNEDVLEPGELDPNVLEQVSRAGERFDRMLREVKSN
jgi:CRP-like cAMP-binding protein